MFKRLVACDAGAARKSVTVVGFLALLVLRLCAGCRKGLISVNFWGRHIFEHVWRICLVLF